MNCPHTRRRYLQACASAIGLAFAGCSSNTPDQMADGETQTTTISSETTTTASRQEPWTPGPWPQFGYDPQNTGWNPKGTGPARDITERWSFDTQGGIESSPTIAENTLYITSLDRHVYALDATTGEEIWRFSTGVNDDGEKDTFLSEPVMRSSPVVHDSIVFVGGGNNIQREQDNQREVIERHIYLYALDAETGDLLWKFQPDGALEGSPTVVDGVVYFGCSAGNLYALGTEEGVEQWRFTEGNKFTSTPAVAEGMLYAGGWDNTLYGIDISDGEEKWIYPTENPVSAAPSIRDGTVYLIQNGGSVVALDALEGGELWKHPSPGTVASSPAIRDGIVYIGDYTGSHDVVEKRLHAIDAETGDNIWSAATDGYLWSSPAVVDDMVYVGCLNNNIYGFDASSGEELWRFATDDLVRSSPAVSGNTLYIGGLDGTVYALTEHDSGSP